MTCRVRIRGIYATALTKLLLDKGYTIVQPSDVIVSRFRIENPSYAPPDVTVKDSEKTRGALTLIGKCWAVDKVLSDLYELCDEIFVWRCKVPLHAVIKAVVKRVESNRVVFDLGQGVEGVLPTLSAPLYREGDCIPVTVTKTAVTDDEEILVSTDLRVDGEYASLVPGGRVFLSRHIKDPERKAELLSLGMMFLDKLGGYGIKWRSSAQYADTQTLISEVESLIDRLNQLRERAASAQPYEVLQEGECIVEIVLSARARRVLDDIRNEVTPTVINHHSLKIFMRKTTVIDYTEHILSYVPDRRAEVSRALLDYMFSRMYKMVIRHVKPDGTVLKIGPAQILKYENDELLLYRKLRAGGVLDGLGVEKQEGDFAITYIKLGEMYVVHAYFDKDRKLKGAYININTPVEPTKGGVMYVDLYVDVVKRADEPEPRVIDLEQLENLRARGVIRDSFYERVMSLVDSVRSRFDELLRPCLDMCAHLDEYLVY